MRRDLELIHPELRRVGMVLPRAPVTPGTTGIVRRLIRLAAAQRWPGTTVETAGSVSVRVHRPSTPPHPTSGRPGILWIHGGGYVVGHPAMDDAGCRRLSTRFGAVVVAPRYRLAPEHPFPAALEDCHEALVWMAGLPEVDPTRIVIGGASAGGGLGAAVCLLARERGVVSPVLQFLHYPMLDDRTALRDDIDEAGFRLWVKRANWFGWESYLGCPPGSSGVSGLAAPARAVDLSGLPPAWIGVGTVDLFHDEDVAYARRLEDAGVECRLDVVEGAFHGFDRTAPFARISRDFVSSRDAAIASALELT